MASDLLNISGNFFNIQRFSLQDGPGIRTTVFMKGCPLSCIWCHNPEGLSAECELSFDVKKCIGCGECAKICPVGAHLMKDGVHIIERERCTSCMRCVGVCPSRAIEQAGRLIETIDPARAFEKGDILFLSGTKGGLNRLSEWANQN